MIAIKNATLVMKDHLIPDAVLFIEDGLIADFGGKDVSTLRWYHFKWNWVNKFLRWVYV